MIPFSVPTLAGSELQYVEHAVRKGTLSGDGEYTTLCQNWLEKKLSAAKVFLTPSGTAALDLAALVLNIQPGDEVIVPSYTYVSTANAFLLRGASLVFVDIVPETMNMDIHKLQDAITDKTRAIVPVHYAGVACDMDALLHIAHERGVYVVEDAAQGLFSTYKGRALGTIGHIGCFSFHESKNVTAGGQGGAILINDPSLVERAEIIRDKGTDRQMFLRGEVPHYTWQQAGASYTLSEIQAAYLWGQLEAADRIQHHRLEIWGFYYRELSKLCNDAPIALPWVPSDCQHNAHIFFIKVADGEQRKDFMTAMKGAGITVLAHYSPLHSTAPGTQGRHVLDRQDFATRESERLVRLPIFYTMTMEQARTVVETIEWYFMRRLAHI
ncbi:pyridoxal phosphate-dependent transferase [Aspergillus pseudonomiae]|uniref:Pyridoxal phosphate-dependent transferase n=1 Tax=Aspergillus pseudonomiae TaxID=1506151 RepID=A0A5N6IJ14_9EURO|nr:pyridoxal phosphate-dependent transferase [Aspergillus pseudonomiae]KAB8266356.1 pyridoxal phosphate-dependent transferase [Aspergillus pseudonomiae]KAE8404511.1 pyridoxal phosphate-dependent transferase [Aspergillus pseudonomiae]